MGGIITTSGVMTWARLRWLTVAMGVRDPQVDTARMTAYSLRIHLIPKHRHAAPDAGASRHGCRRTDLGPLGDTAEAKELSAVVMPNMVKYAQEHGVELPAELL